MSGGKHTFAWPGAPSGQADWEAAGNGGFRAILSYRAGCGPGGGEREGGVSWGAWRGHLGNKLALYADKSLR